MTLNGEYFMATKSASNVAERQPVSTAASANVVGTHGSGFAASLLKFLEEKASAAIKIQVSLKDKLKGFYDFSAEDFTAYFAETKKYREAIKAEADKAKLTVTKFRECTPGVDYVYVSISEFDRLAKAVSTGWRPDVDRLTWAAIKAEATARLDSVAKDTAINQTKEELAKWAADNTADKEVKAANILILNKRMEELATTRPTSAGAGQGQTVNTKTNFQRACEMIEKFPLQDKELIHAWLGQHLEAIAKVKGPAVSTTLANDPVSRGNKAAQTRANKTAESEKAVASSGKKTKRSRK
jgi:hypothetical protein